MNKEELEKVNEMKRKYHYNTFGFAEVHVNPNILKKELKKSKTKSMACCSG